MRKLFLFLSITSLILLGIVQFGFTSDQTVHAEERININKLQEKSLKLEEKASSHERFQKKTVKKQSENRTVNVEATAYTAFCEGCSGTTYTGIDLKANPGKKVIAVDPDVIPLGSRVRVPGYGVAIAGDIGGDIEGHRIDVFIPTESNALEFGRRQLEVEILS